MMTRSSPGTASNSGAASGPAAMVNRAPGWRSTDATADRSTIRHRRSGWRSRKGCASAEQFAMQLRRFYRCCTTVASVSSEVIRPARNRVGPATVDPEPLLPGARKSSAPSVALTSTIRDATLAARFPVSGSRSGGSIVSRNRAPRSRSTRTGSTSQSKSQREQRDSRRRHRWPSRHFRIIRSTNGLLEVRQTRPPSNSVLSGGKRQNLPIRQMAREQDHAAPAGKGALDMLKPANLHRLSFGNADTRRCGYSAANSAEIVPHPADRAGCGGLEP